MKLIEKLVTNFHHTVQVISEKELIGFRRTFSDKNLYVRLQDIIVHPRFQRKGKWSNFIKLLLRFYEEFPRKDLIRVFAAEGAEGFYSKLGLEELPLKVFQVPQLKKNYKKVFKT